MKHRAVGSLHVVATFATGGVLAVAVGLGLHVPDSWQRTAPDDVTLQHSARDPRFETLSDHYVRSVLGIDGGVASGQVTGLSEPTRSSAATPTPSSGGRADVTHPFTNDSFGDAIEITSLPFRAQSDSASATREASEPRTCGSTGGTAWYRFRPSTDMSLLADTFGTGRTTALGVFRGTELDDLEPIGCDTNVLGNAQVGFRAAAGSTYYFQIGSPLRGGPTVFELLAVGPTTVETVSPSGERADAPTGVSYNRPELSTDGRWVTFSSGATNLAPTRPDCGDVTDECHTIYLRDRRTRRTSIVVTSPARAGGGLGWQTLSGDGRYVGFGFQPHPAAAGGFLGDPEAPRGQISVYLADRLTGRIELVSRNSAGEPASSSPGRTAGMLNQKGVPVVGEGSQAVMMSTDARFVAFTSNGTNMGGHTEQGFAYNVYWRDRRTGVTRLVSVDAQGHPMRKANSFSCAGRNMSGDGRYVLFCSTFGTGENNGDHMLLYLWDATTGRTRLVTPLPRTGATAGNFCPSISLDGRRGAFATRDALIPEDTNGTPDVYSFDTATLRLRRVSVTSAGEQTTEPRVNATESSTGVTRAVTQSADGRFVAFDSAAPNLVPTWVGGSRPRADGAAPLMAVFVHDLVTGATVLGSMSESGRPLTGHSVVPYISSDGRWISFFNSSRWATSNGNDEFDVMVHRFR